MKLMQTRHVNNENINMNIQINNTDDSVCEALRLLQHGCLQ